MKPGIGKRPDKRERHALACFLAGAGAIFGLTACGTRITPARSPAVVEPVVRKLAPDIDMEVDPRIELLSVVLGFTDWAKSGEPGYAAPGQIPYYDELRASMRGWEKDEAAARSQSLLRHRSFSYDAPPAMALSTLGGLAFDPPSEGFSDYLKNRAGGEDALVDFSAALRNLAASSGFADFYDSKRAWYGELIERAASGLDAPRLSAWLREWYGGKDAIFFHYVLAPAMPQGGGYGTTVVRREGEGLVKHVYQIIRKPQAIMGGDLAALTLHEFGHAFVNPAIGDRLPETDRDALQRLFMQVKREMNDMAYGEISTFLNELVLRAVTIRAQESLGLGSSTDASLDNEANRGFYCIRAVYAMLPDYENDRARWPSFLSFGPVILDRLAARADALAAEYAAARARRRP